MMEMGIFTVITWVFGLILGIMWLFLPWIIISKIDQVIEELKKMNAHK